MASIQSASIPEGSFLCAYKHQPGGYTDCFSIEVPGAVRLDDYIRAFFNSPVFRLERLVLTTLFRQSCTAEQIEQLAIGQGTQLTLWQVEDRAEDQILMAVKDSPIRTWLMVAPHDTSGSTTTLYFGSALLPTITNKSGQPDLAPKYKNWTALHQAYSKLLLRATVWGRGK